MSNERFMFRGMTVNGQWVYGYLSIIEKGQKADIEPGYYISNTAGKPFAFKVRPETVGQCTELRDKNGKLIYDGDVVKCDIDFVPDGRVGLTRTVIFKDGAFQLSSTDGGFYFIMGFHNIEIIGNIHEMEGI